MWMSWYFAPADGQFVLLHAYSGYSTVPPNELQCAEERMLAWREQHK